MFITAFNLVLILLGFGLLIFVHELGHFLAARWAGIRTEAFAVGMGPVALAWRKGIGFAPKSTYYKVIEKTGKAPADLSDEELHRHGLGETEYSLRWLPIGGFVKMLGQEDANPNYVSDDPRSYNRCPIGKRMIVVSAGVIMNLILAAILFIVVFMVGVRFEAPVIGQVSAVLPAGTTMPTNAEAAGVTDPGLKPGDRVVEIDGRPARTFSDIQIAAAMSRPDRPVQMTVHRPGVELPLTFPLQPQRDQAVGLLAIGVAPASSTQLTERDRGGVMEMLLARASLAKQGVEPGMVLLEANGVRIDTFQQFEPLVQQSDGRALATLWSRINRDGEPQGQPITAYVEVSPVLETYRLPEVPDDAIQNFDSGLLGLSPLVRIASVEPKSPNLGILQAGDVVLSAGDHVAPRLSQFHEIIRNWRDRTLPMKILRDGETLKVDARIERRGRLTDERRLNVIVGLALDEPRFADPIERVRRTGPQVQESAGPPQETRATPIAPHGLLPGSRIVSANEMPVNDWTEFRAMLRAALDSEHVVRGEEGHAVIDLRVAHPLETNSDSEAGRQQIEVVRLELSEADVQALLALGWQSPLGSYLFEPIHTVVSAGTGVQAPGRALVMGVQETHKMVVLTYLTIDRLFRGTVGVEQLRGPVGIIHLGATIADRGFLYLLFLLAVVSVNLAVINFLPLPIVDGGLFLFLIYEKIKGKPPTIAFQNAVTILGLFLIGTVFIVVTYHDILRLVS